MTTTVTNVQNDGNPALTQIVEATASGDTASAISLRNDGTLTLGNTNHHGSISSDNAKVTTDGSGNLTANNLTAGGTLSVTGNASIAGTLSASPKVLQFSTFTATLSGSGTVSTTVSHGLGATPSAIMVQPTGSTPGNLSNWKISNITSTQCTLTGNSGLSYNVTFNCIALR